MRVFVIDLRSIFVGMRGVVDTHIACGSRARAGKANRYIQSKVRFRGLDKRVWSFDNLLI